LLGALLLATIVDFGLLPLADLWTSVPFLLAPFVSNLLSYRLGVCFSVSGVAVFSFSGLLPAFVFNGLIVLYSACRGAWPCMACFGWKIISCFVISCMSSLVLRMAFVLLFDLC
jgi:hypothetical protein